MYNLAKKEGDQHYTINNVVYAFDGCLGLLPGVEAALQREAAFLEEITQEGRKGRVATVAPLVAEATKVYEVLQSSIATDYMVNYVEGRLLSVFPWLGSETFEFSKTAEWVAKWEGDEVFQAQKAKIDTSVDAFLDWVFHLYPSRDVFVRLSTILSPGFATWREALAAVTKMPHLGDGEPYSVPPNQEYRLEAAVLLVKMLRRAVGMLVRPSCQGVTNLVVGNFALIEGKWWEAVFDGTFSPDSQVVFDDGLVSFMSPLVEFSHDGEEWVADSLSVGAPSFKPVALKVRSAVSGEVLLSGEGVIFKETSLTVGNTSVEIQLSFGLACDVVITRPDIPTFRQQITLVRELVEWLPAASDEE